MRAYKPCIRAYDDRSRPSTQVPGLITLVDNLRPVIFNLTTLENR